MVRSANLPILCFLGLRRKRSDQTITNKKGESPSGWGRRRKPKVFPPPTQKCLLRPRPPFLFPSDPLARDTFGHMMPKKTAHSLFLSSLSNEIRSEARKPAFPPVTRQILEPIYLRLSPFLLRPRHNHRRTYINQGGAHLSKWNPSRLEEGEGDEEEKEEEAVVSLPSHGGGGREDSGGGLDPEIVSGGSTLNGSARFGRSFGHAALGNSERNSAL